MRSLLSKTSTARFSTKSVDGPGLINLLKTPVLVIDVRDAYEIAETGRLSDRFDEMKAHKHCTYGEITLNQILEGGLSLDADEFEDAFEFPKPSLDETVVFSCAAGVRSATAQKVATDAGYPNTINYSGGWHEFCQLEL